MGLDMYLYRDVEMFSAKADITVINHSRDGDKEIKSHVKKITSYTEEVLYWRKCNAIHNWFVRNVQNGEDDCGDYEVTIDKLLELKDTCEKVVMDMDSGDVIIGNVDNGWTMKEDPITQDVIKKQLFKEGKIFTNVELANQLLPTISGFFFGSTEINEYYYNDLVSTIKGINEIVESHERLKEFAWGIKYTYQSSW